MLTKPGRSLRPEMLFLFSLKIGNVEGSFASMKRKKGVQVRGLQGEYIQTSSHGDNWIACFDELGSTAGYPDFY